MNLQKLFCALLLAPTLALAVDTAYSPPVGGMTITVPAGQTRSVALPILESPVGTGAVVGTLTGVGSNYLDVANAGWTAEAFSNPATPYYVRIKSGSASGRVLMVSSTANTASRVYVNNDGVDLTASGGPQAGDSYEIVLADTLSSLFGTSVQGSADFTTADVVQVWNNTGWLSFYYNSARSRWERNTDTASSPSRDNFVLRPDRGILVTRRASTELKMYVTGRVPDKAPKHFHGRPSVTFLNTGIPTDMTLGALSLQTRIAGWTAGTNPSTSTVDADIVQVWNNTGWLIFYYDSSTGYWRRNLDIVSSGSRNSFVIPAGRPIMIRRLTSNGNAADALISFDLPYTL